MHSRRLIGSLLATTLAATSWGMVATAAPASAVATVQTRIVPSGTAPVFSSYSKSIAYGDSISISVNVEAFVSGAWEQIYHGNVSVTQKLAGSSTSTQVAVSDPDDAWIYDSIPAVGKAVYTVNYAGGSGGYPTVNYAPTSASYSISNVHRKLSITPQSGKKLGLAGKVAPKGKVKLTVLQKHGKKWKKFKSVKTKSNGKFMVRLPAPRKRGAKLFWRIDIKGSSRFAPTKSGVYYTTKY